MQQTDYNEIVFTVNADDIDRAADLANMAGTGGIYVEDYRNLEQDVAEIAHIDLIDQQLLQQDREVGKVHLYLDVAEHPGEVTAYLSELYRSAGIDFSCESHICRYADWGEKWKQYFKTTDIGNRLRIRPAWEEKQKTERKEICLEPGLAFGTGTHETTRLCLEFLDEYIRGGEKVLDIGCGSGILAIAALLLGADSAIGVDIDELAVKTANENAAQNGVQARFIGVCGDLVEKISGRFDVVLANIVADVILLLNQSVLQYMNSDTLYLMSGIIDTREPEIVASLAEHFDIIEIRRDRGWTAIAARPKKEHI